jgi:uncharacterized membrane protein
MGYPGQNTGLIIFIIMILWIVALVDVLRSRFDTSTDKLIWTLVVIFVPLAGIILYFFIGRRQKVPRAEHSGD